MPSRVALAAGGAGADDEAVGDVAVEHQALLAAEPPAVAGALGARRDAVRGRSGCARSW